MNIYWPVYKNLESQFANLMFDIHIDDKQLDVYSLRISDLIVRAAIEIESISKDLYLLNNGTKRVQIKYDEDALVHLNKLWFLDKKVIIISSTNCFLTNRLIYPFLKNEPRTGNTRMTYGWNNAYQNIKHDRANSLRFASIKYLLQIMSALFTLNIYYKNETFDLGRDSQSTSFPINLGSDIFSISLHKWFIYDGNDVYGKKENFDECIYLTKMTDISIDKSRNERNEKNLKLLELFKNHPKFIKYSSENDINQYNGSNFMWDVLGKDDFYRLNQQAGVYHIEENPLYEAIINKNSI